MFLLPSLSTITPKKGENKVPVKRNAAYIPKIIGELVSFKTYQDRITSSMNSAHESAKSPSHIYLNLTIINDSKDLPKILFILFSYAQTFAYVKQNVVKLLHLSIEEFQNRLYQ